MAIKIYLVSFEWVYIAYKGRLLGNKKKLGVKTIEYTKSTLIQDLLTQKLRF